MKERWHRHYSVQKLDRGSEEMRVPVVRKVKLRKEALDVCTCSRLRICRS